MSLADLKAKLPALAFSVRAFAPRSKGEEVLLVIRKHWIVDVVVAFKALVYLGIPGGVLYYFKLQTAFFENDGGRLVLLVFALYTLYILLLSYVSWMVQNLDVIIFTTDRVIDVNQNSLFERENAETNLSEVQDAHAKVSGILGTLLHFGSLTIQTAAEKAFFEMDHVTHPDETVHWLLTIREWAVEQNSSQGLAGPKASLGISS